MANFKKSMSMLTTATVLASTLAVNASAATATSVPNLTVDGFVGLVNNPAVAGTAQQFYLTSANYDGDVQYQIFYIDAANPNRDDATKWTKLQDWTKPVNAKTPFLYNIPSLQAGAYSFAVRVKRAGYTPDMTVGYNAAGEYDDAYPFNYTFQTKASVDVSGIKVDKATVAAGEKVTISGLTGGSKYRLYSFNQASAEKWVYSSEGSSLDWTPKAPGNYVLDVQVLDSANKVAGWKLINVNVADGKVVSNATSVKAVNSTTVYVTFGADVQNVSKDQFTIDGGLTVTNAAVKQDDSKTVVLTTSAQTGGNKYTLSYKGDKVGEFTGASSVVPTSIKFTSNTTSVKVGTNAVVTADIGQKVAGVPVTFNVVSSQISDTTKDQVAEVLTDANGIATYNYSRYVPSVDTVYAYATGAPQVRDNTKIFWGVEPQLQWSLQPTTTTVNNETAQTYTILLKDKDGKAVESNQQSDTKVFVTFDENIDTDLSNDSSAKVDGLKPYQTSDNHYAKRVYTDANGSGTFTISGTNTKATPVVYVYTGTGTNNYTDDTAPKYEKDMLQLKGTAIQFSNSLSGYKVTVDKTSPITATAGSKSASEYKYTFKVTKADGTVAAGVNCVVGFNELLDSSINTNTDAKFSQDDSQKYVKATDNDGKLEVKVYSNVANVSATPVLWIDLDGTQDGVRQDGEPYCIAPTISFYDEKVMKGSVGFDETYVATTGDLVTGDDVRVKFALKNQSDNDYSGTDNDINKVTWTISNTGSYYLATTAQVLYANNTAATTPQVIGLAPGSSTTFTTSGLNGNKAILKLTAPNQANSDITTVKAPSNIVAADIAKKDVTLQVQAVGTTEKNYTYTGTFSTNVRYALNPTESYGTPTLVDGSITGKVAGFMKGKTNDSINGQNSVNQFNNPTNKKDSIVRILVEVDGMSNKFVWIDASAVDTTSGSGNTKIGTDTTFTDNNFLPLNVAIPSDKKLKDYLSVGDKVQFTVVSGTAKLLVANVGN